MFKKEAWRPTPKWNTRFFFAFSERTQLWLPNTSVWKELGKFPWENKEKGRESKGLRGKNNKISCCS